MTEAHFQSAVIEASRLLGWKVAHFRPGRNLRGKWLTAVSGDGVGFPDLVLVHPAGGKVLAVELKTDKGQPTESQLAWLEWFRACGVRAEVWRPKDWPRIEGILKRARPAEA
jgi:hypothetical protein